MCCVCTETVEDHSQTPKKAYKCGVREFCMYGGLLVSGLSLHRGSTNSLIAMYKNEVGCRDDTVPKTVDTRRHCEEE